MSTKADRPRLDVYLVQAGLAPTRERARAAIMAGHVYVAGRRVDKAGYRVEPEQTVEVRADPLPFVSRGGLKLAKALDEFALSVKDLVCMDIGASTGGFTDCLLQRGARRVYAVDVGYGQLDWRLRADPRVVVLERTNARYLTSQHVPEKIEFLTVDVSFISLRKVLEPVRALLAEHARGVALVKPQFEAGRRDVGKGGVVRDSRVHVRVLLEVLAWLPEVGFRPLGVTFSPIRGPRGNLEFLVAFECRQARDGVASASSRRTEAESPADIPATEPAPGVDLASWRPVVERVVAQAHAELPE